MVRVQDLKAVPLFWKGLLFFGRFFFFFGPFFCPYSNGVGIHGKVIICTGLLGKFPETARSVFEGFDLNEMSGRFHVHDDFR